MSKARSSDVSVHRFFHAMVVMGGTVAVGCGGVTSGRQESGGTPPDPASGGSGGAVNGVGGTSGFSTGGSITLYTGGTSGVGGTSALNTGGAGGVVGAPGCAPAQWDCGTNVPNCSSTGQGVSLPTGCTCNETRPLTAASCAPGQTYVCWEGVDDTGQSVPFQCSCVGAPSDCWACDQVFNPVPGGMYNCDFVAHEGGVGDVLCGCAVVFLR